MNNEWLTGTWPSGGFTLYLPAIGKLKLADLNRVCDLIGMTDKSLANIIHDYDMVIEAISNADISEKQKNKRIKEVQKRKEKYEKLYHWEVI